MKINRILLVGLLLGLVSMFVATCDRDCPSCPDEVEITPCRLYGFDHYNKLLMSIDVPADTIIDSLRVDYNGAEVFVTPDGKKLLVMRFNYETGHRMEVYNTADLSYAGSLELYGLYYFDGTDNYCVCMAFDSVCFIDPITLTLNEAITLPYSGDEAFLDTVTDRLFVPTTRSSDTANVIYEFDCLGRSLVDSVILPEYYGDLRPIAYNWRTDDLYAMAMIQTGIGYLYLYDITTDSITNYYPIRTVTGSISISPDGRIVYATDGGNGMLFIEPSRPIWVIDALSGNPITWIPPYDSAGLIWPYFHLICFTPDGNRAYIDYNSSSGGGNGIIVIDSRNHNVIRRIAPYSICWPSIALGPVPNN